MSVNRSYFWKMGRKEGINAKRLRLTKTRCSVSQKMKRVRAAKARVDTDTQ